MRHIKLSGKLGKGKYAIVDNEDFEEYSKLKWNYQHGYASRMSSRKDGPQRMIFMHRLINNTTEGYDTDHINRNKLDNRHCNLRTATRSENQQNVGIRKDNTSGVKGINYNITLKRWSARIQRNKVRKLIGFFKTKDEAVNAMNGALC